MPFTWRDLLDILLVTVLFYYLWRLISGTRALNLVRGVLVYLLVWFFASLLGLSTLSWLLGNAATLGAFALIVVFQPELRGLLERLGRAQGPRAASLVLEELLLGMARLAERRYGALIALERRTPLGEYAATGEVVEARLSARLLVTLFHPGTPLHDGGLSSAATGSSPPAASFPSPRPTWAWAPGTGRPWGFPRSPTPWASW